MVITALFHASIQRHYAILNDHLHFLAEGEDRQALSRGIQGLLVRIAKALNKRWKRKGSVFADRLHERVLKTPREVHNCIRYLLANGKKHAAEGREVSVPQAINVYTSRPGSMGGGRASPRAPGC
jgi:putative transposase